MSNPNEYNYQGRLKRAVNLLIFSLVGISLSFASIYNEQEIKKILRKAIFGGPNCFRNNKMKEIILLFKMKSNIERFKIPHYNWIINATGNSNP